MKERIHDLSLEGHTNINQAKKGENNAQPRAQHRQRPDTVVSGVS